MLVQTSSPPDCPKNSARTDGLVRRTLCARMRYKNTLKYNNILLYYNIAGTHAVARTSEKIVINLLSGHL